MSALFSTSNKYKKKSKVIDELMEGTISIGVLIRVSTDMQAEEGDSLEMQLELAKEHEKDIKGVIYKTYIEEGVSASKTRIEKRDAIQELMQDIRDGKVNYLIAYKRDRMFRNTMEYISFIQFLADHGVDVFLTARGEQQIDLEAFKFAGASKMMEVIMSMVNEMESATTANRVSDTMIMKAKKGEFTGGSLPIGYTFAESGHRFKLIEGAREAIKLVEDLYLEGYGLFSIAKYMNGASIKGKEALESPIPKPIRKEESSSDEWNHRNIQTILFNPIYTGHFSYESKMNPEMERQIKKSDLIETCRTEERQMRINSAHEKRKGGVKERVPLSTSFLLSGLIYCAECGQSLKTTSTQPKGTKSKFSYYSCKGNARYRKVDCEHKTSYRKEIIEKIVVDVAKEKIKRFLVPENIELARLKLEEDKYTYSSEADKVAKDIKKLQVKLDNISDLVSELDDDIELQVIYLKKQKALLAEINDLKETYATLEVKAVQDKEDNFNLEEFIGLAEKFGNIFDAAPIGVKKQMLNQLFSNIHINKEGDVRMKLKVGLTDLMHEKASDDGGSDDLNEVMQSITGRSPVVSDTLNVLIKSTQEFDIKINYHEVISQQALQISELFMEYVNQFDKLADPNNSMLLLNRLDSIQLKRVTDKKKRSESMFRTYFTVQYKSSHHIAKSIQEVGYTYASMSSFLNKHNLTFSDFFDYIDELHDIDMDEDFLSYLMRSRLAVKERKYETNEPVLFLGKMKCEVCGSTYTRKVAKVMRYICSNRHRSKQLCNTKVSSVTQEKIIKQIKKELNTNDMHDEQLAEKVDMISIDTDGNLNINYN